MNNKEICTIKYREIDFIEDQILLLKRKIDSIRLDISHIKKAIYDENKNNIGRLALVATEDGSHIVLPCSHVFVSEDFEPIFHFSSKKYDKNYHFIEWHEI